MQAHLHVNHSPSHTLRRTQAAKKQSLTELYFDQEQGALVVTLSSNTLETFPLTDPNFQPTGSGSITFTWFSPPRVWSRFPLCEIVISLWENPIQFRPKFHSIIVRIDDGIIPKKPLFSIPSLISQGNLTNE